MFSEILLNEKSKMHTWMYKPHLKNKDKKTPLHLHTCICVYWRAVNRVLAWVTWGPGEWECVRGGWGRWGSETLVKGKGSCLLEGRAVWQDQGHGVRLHYSPALPPTSGVTVEVQEHSWSATMCPVWDPLHRCEDTASPPQMLPYWGKKKGQYV